MESSTIDATPAHTRRAITDASARLLVECCPVGLSLHGAHGEFRAASETCARVFGRDCEALLQHSLAQLVDTRDRERVQAEWADAALRGRDTTLRYRLSAAADEPRWIETEVRVNPPRAEAEKARRLLELSAPIIPLGADVLILPLIGTLDPTRAEHALTALVHAVQRTHARRVIIDLTGVASVDAQSLTRLLHAAKAVRLLGARPMLTGIRPDVAEAVLALGLSLADLGSYGSLDEALQAP